MNSQRERLPVKGIESPEDLLARLDGESAKREALLALVQAEAVREDDGDSLVVLKPLVVCANGAVHEGQDEALKGDDGVVHGDGLEGALPLLLADGNLLEVRELAREGGDAEDKIQLGKLVVVLDLVRVGDELLVDAQEGRLVEYGEQRRPLLEVDVDAAVREEPGRDPHGRRRGIGGEGIAALDVKERLWVEVGARLSTLLQSPLEGLCG